MIKIKLLLFFQAIIAADSDSRALPERLQENCKSEGTDSNEHLISNTVETYSEKDTDERCP